MSSDQKCFWAEIVLAVYKREKGITEKLNSPDIRYTATSIH